MHGSVRVTRGEQQLVKKGGFHGVDISVEKRQGGKKVRVCVSARWCSSDSAVGGGGGMVPGHAAAVPCACLFWASSGHCCCCCWMGRKVARSWMRALIDLLRW